MLNFGGQAPRSRRAQHKRPMAKGQLPIAKSSLRSFSLTVAQERGTRNLKRILKFGPMFIINLNYTAPLEKIDAAMKDHMVFLNACYKEGLFIVSGRKIPRTGGIIIAQASSKEAMEALMRNDPFVAQGLAEMEVIEFQESQMSKKFKEFLSDKRDPE